jgi:hypothetical protein
MAHLDSRWVVFADNFSRNGAVLALAQVTDFQVGMQRRHATFGLFGTPFVQTLFLFGHFRVGPPLNLRSVSGFGVKVSKNRKREAG